MSTIRTVKSKDFTTICNTFLRDERLSWKAKGILAYLLSKPDDWKVRVSDLIKRSTDGREKVYAGVNELLTTGYLQRTEVRSKGKIISYEYVLYETGMPEPHTGFPDTVKPDTKMPHTGFPDTKKPHILNTDSIPNTDLNKILTDQRLTAPAKLDSQKQSRSVGQSVSSESLFSMCKRQSKGVMTLIKSGIKKYGVEYVKSQIEYCNVKCRNLRAYRFLLSDAINGDFAEGWKDDKLFSETLDSQQKEKKRSESEAAKAKLIAEKAETERQKQKELEISSLIESLPADQMEKLKSEFINVMPEIIKRSWKKQGWKSMSVKIHFEKYVQNQMEVA